jgi:hypothetical protein
MLKTSVASEKWLRKLSPLSDRWKLVDRREMPGKFQPHDATLEGNPLHVPVTFFFFLTD